MAIETISQFRFSRSPETIPASLAVPDFMLSKAQSSPSANFLMANYRRLPVAFVSGRGAVLTDIHGHDYLDALSGIAVCNLGHAHPEVAAAIADQAARLIHTSNVYEVPHQERLAETLCGLSSMDAAFFCNSGAEANEAAIKLVRSHAHASGNDQPVILTFAGGFHGRTFGALSAAGAGNPARHAAFAPLLPGFEQVPYDDLDAIERALRANDRICAVMLEPVQGEGGVNVPEVGFLAAVRELCDRHDCLMVLDEVQSGMCRTGRWFAFQHEAVRPDVMTLAKALANGVPIGACLARGEAATRFSPGSHGSTFGGNPLATYAALTVLEVMTQNDSAAAAADLGEQIKSGLRAHLGDLDPVRDIRGRGLMIGVELDRPCGELVASALAEGVLVNVTAERVIRLLPPLVISPDQADRIVTTVAAVVRRFLGA